MNNVLQRSSIFLGRCTTSDVSFAVRVCINTLEMDERFLMYFDHKNYVYATDTKNECSPGDYVLIRAAANKNKLITHTVEKLIYRMGYSVDPLTGKKCFKDQYVDDIISTSALFGKKPPYLASKLEEPKNEPNEEDSQQ